jgi:HlyD family secretion protein
MMKAIFDLFKLLTLEQKKAFYWLQLLVVLSACFDVVGIASVAPFIALVNDIELLQSNPLLSTVYSFFGNMSSKDFVFLMGCGVLLLLAFSAIISMYTVARLSRFAASVGADISFRLFSHYMRQDWTYFTQISSSQLVNKIAVESQRVTSQVLLPLVNMNAKSISAMAIVLAIVIYNPIVALVGFSVFSAVYILLFRFVRGSLAKNGENISRMLAKRFSLMGDAFGGAKDLILFERKEYFLRKFERSGQGLADSFSLNAILGQMPRYAIEFLAFGLVVSLLLIFFMSSERGLMDALPELSLYALASLKVLPSLQHVYSAATQIKGNLKAFESIRVDLEDSVFEDNQSHDFGIKRESDLCLKRSINLSNISFTYPQKDTPALHDISLHIPAQSTVGFVGPSGSGKSTLVDLVMGLITPAEGRIEIDGKILSQHNLGGWKGLIGYVPQAIFLSEGSIAENVAFGLGPDEINYDRVDTALKAADLTGYVDSLASGVNSLVGERGVQLSGGQRQRIGIARALYHDPEVLVFDEATSALDGVTERVIMDAIDSFEGSKTIIIIAHRLKTIKNCNQIFYIEKGSIVAQGKYSELLSRNAMFRKLDAHS